MSKKTVYENQFRVETALDFDREEQDSYVVHFKCSDYGSPSQESQKILTVILVDMSSRLTSRPLSK